MRKLSKEQILLLHELKNWSENFTDVSAKSYVLKHQRLQRNKVMGSIKALLDKDYEDWIDDTEEQGLTDGVYPKKLHVDGYDVNHYHNGDVPIYEILDSNGKVIDVAHSTNEMHEITGSIDKDRG